MKQKVYLAILRWLLSKWVKQGRLHLLQPLYRALYETHLKEFPEDSKWVLKESIVRDFKEANGDCCMCGEMTEKGNRTVFVESQRTKFACPAHTRAIPEDFIVSDYK